MNHEWIENIPKSYIYVDDTGTLGSLYKVGLIQTDWCILEEWENIKYIPMIIIVKYYLRYIIF